MNERIKAEITDNARYYNLALDVVEFYYGKGQLEQSLDLTMQTTLFAMYNFCGFYSDARVESFLRKVSAEISIIKTEPTKPIDTAKKLKILHVSTEVYNTGGHTRGILRWIQTDTTNYHDVILTDQSLDTPDFFTESIYKCNGQLYVFSNKNTFHERISFLRNISGNYDVIILHHQPNDIIPVIALTHGNSIPVAIVDHADYFFGVGSSMCDCLVELRENMLELNKTRRCAQNVFFLPIVLLPKQESFSKQDAKTKLGLENKTIIVSIGNYFKFTPTPDKNFFEDIIPILNKHTDSHLIVIGVSSESALGIKYKHPSITYVGLTKDIELYKYACDIYAECYPISSQGAVLEVAALGKPILLAYDPSPLQQYYVSAYTYKMTAPASRAEWQNTLELWVTDTVARAKVGEKIYDNINSHHIGNNWIPYVNSFYNYILRLKHNLRPILPTVKLYSRNEEDLVILLKNLNFPHPYLMGYLQGLPFKLKLKIIFSKYSFNLHSAKLFVYYILGIKEKT